MKEMLFIAANANWPRGTIWSTARRGDKWLNDARPGDVLELMVTESRKLMGRATVISTRLGTFKGVCEAAAADKNHALSPALKPEDAAEALAAGLRAAYGDDIKDDEPFTVVTLMAHNPV